MTVKAQYKSLKGKKEYVFYQITESLAGPQSSCRPRRDFSSFC